MKSPRTSLKSLLAALLLLPLIASGQTSLVNGKGGGVTDPDAFRAAIDAAHEDLDRAGDVVNSQPFTAARISAWTSSLSAPLRGAYIGDSLSSNSGTFGLGPNMGRAGHIGLSIRSGSITGTVTDHSFPNTGRTDIWINGAGQTFAIGSSAEFTVNGSATGDIRGDRACVAWVAGPGKGSFDLQYQVNATGAWTTLGTINTANASTIGVFQTYNLPTSNSPFFRLRVNNVTGGIVELAPLTGIYNSTGGGVIYIAAGMASGLDITPNVLATPSAVFTPIWTGLAPDYVVSLWADAASSWNSGGAWRTFYAQARAAFANSDWIQISRNPSHEAYLSGYPSWTSGTAYTVGQKVLREVSTGVFRNYNCIGNHTAGTTTAPGTGASWATVWQEFISPEADVASAAIASAQAVSQRTWALAERQTFLNGMEIFGGSWINANARGLMNDVVHPNAAGVTLRNLSLWGKMPLGRAYLGGGLMTGQLLGAAGANLRAQDLTTQPFQYAGPLESTGAAAAVRFADTASPLDNSRNGVIDKLTSGSNRMIRFMEAGTVGGYFDFGSGLIGLYPGGDNWAFGSTSARWNVFGAGMSARQRTVTSATTIVGTDHTIFFDATAGAISQALPAAASHNGRIYSLKKIDSSGNAVTIDPNASETIDGATTISLSAQWQHARIQSNGTAWFRID